jgi:hypothetical protein
VGKNTYPLSQVAKDLNSIISSMLTEYSEELQAKADKVTEQVAQDFAKQLKEVTPRSNDPGEHMADTVEVTAKNERSLGKVTRARFVHYRKWRTSHLLEFGWTSRDGKRVERTPFVRPLIDRNKERYTKMYKEALEKK